jgi:hypothetical protein
VVYSKTTLSYEQNNKKNSPMLNNPAVSSGIDTMNGVWECCCQPYGGDIGG